MFVSSPVHATWEMILEPPICVVVDIFTYIWWFKKICSFLFFEKFVVELVMVVNIPKGHMIKGTSAPTAGARVLLTDTVYSMCFSYKFLWIYKHSYVLPISKPPKVFWTLYFKIYIWQILASTQGSIQPWFCHSVCVCIIVSASRSFQKLFTR